MAMLVITMIKVQDDGDGGAEKADSNREVGTDSSSMTPSFVYRREARGVVEYEIGRT
jgi:hypothetical protein